MIEVTPDSPAAKAGIEAGDVILEFDGKEVEEMRKLPRMVAETKIGKKTQVIAWRKEKVRILSITLGELEEEESTTVAQKHKDGKAPTTSGTDVMGMKVTPLTNKLREKYALQESVSGLLVVDVNRKSANFERGIRRFDIITKVNEEEVTSADALANALESAAKAGRQFALLRILRAGETHFVTIRTQEKE